MKKIISIAKPKIPKLKVNTKIKTPKPNVQKVAKLTTPTPNIIKPKMIGVKTRIN